MSDIAIRVEGLGKQYRLGLTHAGSIRELVSRWGGRFGISRQPDLPSSNNKRHPVTSNGDFWALQDVSFEVRRGEVLGVIGRNGAGKSTLLKILSQVTRPTTGRAEIHGRVGSLLEVGTGFHPELTGRENVFLNASILGMTRAEVRRRFDDIVDFADIAKFMDTPVKRYSSGMKVRLGFAVAAHLEPEILIVDEVLAVGDAEFRKRCLGKMHDVADEGRTVLIVSHSMQTITTLNERCILLQSGQIAAQGDTRGVIRKYLAKQSAPTVYHGQPDPAEPRVIHAVIRTSEVNGVHRHGEPLEVEFVIDSPRTIRNACLSFQFVTALGTPYLHLWTFDSERPMCRSPGRDSVVCTIPQCRLYRGNYSMTVHLSSGPLGDKFETLEGVCGFQVVMHGIDRQYQWRPDTCAYIEDAHWRVHDSSPRTARN